MRFSLMVLMLSLPNAVHAGPSDSEAPLGLSVKQVSAIHTAQSTAKSLGGALKDRLQGSLKTEGPVAALAVCTLEAKPITQSANSSAAVRVGRSSLRLRNPDNTAPKWVAEWLSAQGERKAEGLLPHKGIGINEAGQSVGQFLAPLAIQGPCLLCHGPREGLMPEVQAALTKDYPQDKATGYALGDLRGVIWAEALVED
jgi:hypothetical protein